LHWFLPPCTCRFIAQDGDWTSAATDEYPAHKQVL
jgi:hypothetical protein